MHDDIHTAFPLTDSLCPKCCHIHNYRHGVKSNSRFHDLRPGLINCYCFRSNSVLDEHIILSFSMPLIHWGSLESWSQSSWSQSLLSLGERRATPWTDRQSALKEHANFILEKFQDFLPSRIFYKGLNLEPVRCEVTVLTTAITCEHINRHKLRPAVLSEPLTNQLWESEVCYKRYYSADWILVTHTVILCIIN